jgi:hypothetical protein
MHRRRAKRGKEWRIGSVRDLIAETNPARAGPTTS